MLAEQLPDLDGFPLRWQRTVGREIEQGATTREVRAYTVERLEEITVHPDEFVLPDHFRYQEPVVSGFADPDGRP